MKTCSICKKKLATKNGLAQHMASVHAQGQGPSRRKSGKSIPAAMPGAAVTSMRSSGSSMGDGTITLQRSEILTSIEVADKATSTKGAIKLLPNASVMPWLFKLTSSFDQIVWHSARVYYKPAVGTTYFGSLVLGVDWNPSATAADRTVVQACSPVIEAAAWQPLQLVLPSSRLQSRKFYFVAAPAAQDAAPAAILYNLKCSSVSGQTFVGDIWLEYRVSLLSPSA